MVKQDVINAAGALLLARDVESCPRYSEEMYYLPSSQESFTTIRVIHAITNSNGALGGCKYGF